MSQMVLTVTHSGSGYALDCMTPQGASITFDADGGKHGGSPMQHLLAAAGACALMDVFHILKKKRLEFSNLRVDCVGERVEVGDPKPFTDLKLVFHVDGDVPEKAFQDAVRLSVEKYCSVSATIQGSPPVAWEARIS